MLDLIKKIYFKLFKTKYKYDAPLLLNRKNLRYYKGSRYIGKKSDLNKCRKCQENFYESMKVDVTKECMLPNEMLKEIDNIMEKLNNSIERKNYKCEEK